MHARLHLPCTSSVYIAHAERNVNERKTTQHRQVGRKQTRICLVLHGFAEQKTAETEYAEIGSQPSHCVFQGLFVRKRHLSTIATACQGPFNAKEPTLPSKTNGSAILKLKSIQWNHKQIQHRVVKLQACQRGHYSQ